jgi:anti-sigma regulatory factor (Ser/Thr protein kinase)
MRFPPRAGYIRTARLVAVAVARRCGLDEARLDELRVAVSEACTRALERSEVAGTLEPVLLTVDDAPHGLTVEVSDASSASAAAVPEDPVRLALLQGLADAVEVLPGPLGTGGLVRLEWWR